MTLKEGRQGQLAESVHTHQLPCRPALHTIGIQAADCRLWATICCAGHLPYKNYSAAESTHTRLLLCRQALVAELHMRCFAAHWVKISFWGRCSREATMQFASMAVLQLCALASQAVEAGCARRDATGAVGCAVQAVKKVMSPLRT